MTNRSVIGDSALVLIAASVGAVLIALYAGFAFYKIFMGPSITVVEPRYGAVNATSTLLISGTSKRLSRLRVNGLEVPLTPQGDFALVRTPPKGYTVVTVEGEDRFKRIVRVEVPVIHEPPHQLTKSLLTSSATNTSATSTNQDETKRKESF